MIEETMSTWWQDVNLPKRAMITFETLEAK